MNAPLPVALRVFAICALAGAEVCSFVGLVWGVQVCLGLASLLAPVAMLAWVMGELIVRGRP